MPLFMFILNNDIPVKEVFEFEGDIMEKRMGIVREIRLLRQP